MRIKIPCINCLTLAICRYKALDNPDNMPNSDHIISRYAIKDCQPAVDYVYIEPMNVWAIERNKEITIHTYDKDRISAIEHYFKTLEEPYHETIQSM